MPNETLTAEALSVAADMGWVPITLARDLPVGLKWRAFAGLLKAGKATINDIRVAAGLPALPAGSITVTEDAL